MVSRDENEEEKQFCIVNVATTMENLAQTVERVDLLTFVDVYEQLCKFIGMLGKIFEFVEQDVRQKIANLKILYEKDPDAYSSIHSMVEHEVSQKALHKNSGCHAILHLNRALEFIMDFMHSASTASNEDSIAKICKETYDGTLAKFHPWVIRTAVKLAVYTLPPREKLLELIKGDLLHEDDVREKIFVVVENGKIVHERINSIYTTHDLHKIMINSGMIEECIAGSAITDIAISPNNLFIVTASGYACEILQKERRRENRTILSHESPVVSVFFLSNSKFVAVNENGEVCEYQIDESTRNVEKIESRRVTAFPVIAAFPQNIQENEEYDLWIVIKKENKIIEEAVEICYTGKKSSLELVLEIPKDIRKEQIHINENVVSYCSSSYVKAVLLNKEKKIEKKTQFTLKNKNQNFEQKFIRLSAEGNYLAVVLSNGGVYQWSNLRTAGVSDTFHSSHWHKVAPQIVVTKFGNILTAGAECALARFTKGVKEPTILPRLVAPITRMKLSPDSSSLVLVMEDNSIHIVLLATMAIEASMSAFEYCSRSFNTIFSLDCASSKYGIMNAAPGSIQWVDVFSGKSAFKMSVTMENAVDGDMSLVGINQAYRDVCRISLGKDVMATIEQYVHFDGDSHIRFWKRNSYRDASHVATYAVPIDTEFVAACKDTSVQFGKTIVTATKSGNLSVWEFDEQDLDVREDCSRKRNWQESPINAISSISGSGMFASAHDSNIVLWNVEDMKIQDIISAGDKILSLEFFNRYLIVATESSVTCFDTLCLSIIWRVLQRAKVHISAQACFAFDREHVMQFEAKSGRVLNSFKFSVPVDELLVVNAGKDFAYLAKTSKGILRMKTSATATTPARVEDDPMEIETPFQKLGKLKEDDTPIPVDMKLVKTPNPDGDRLFGGPVHSLPPISFLAPLFIENSLLPPAVRTS
ncbi:unnamed protein product [Caenorhabditis bovis]|uniref:Glycolipid transfer protein domain-containing protein n=1 Tax=Caenorhabditis bovis TaxID=2654633 RepID=A0A8S1F7Z3_9PELO|nr:unnamed protein product [Caenorhabditis bovis]